MTLPLTPDTLRACYDFLSTTPPFNKWNLPEGEDVVFRVGKTALWCAQMAYDPKTRRYTITVSQRKTSQTVTLAENMAHEMVHVHLHQAGIDHGTLDVNHHSMAYQRCAKQVCKIHGFDYHDFF